MRRHLAAAVLAVGLTQFAPQCAPRPQTTAAVTHQSRWDRIAHCESGGQWQHRPVTNRFGTFSGGLMIWHKAWDAYGGKQFARYPYLASKAQQIVVAERIWADRGSRAWQCK